MQQVIQIYFFSPCLTCLMCIQWCQGKNCFTPLPLTFGPCLGVPGSPWGCLGGSHIPLSTGTALLQGENSQAGSAGSSAPPRGAAPLMGIKIILLKYSSCSALLSRALHKHELMTPMARGSVIRARGGSSWEPDLPLLAVRSGISLTWTVVILSNYSSGRTGGGV